MVFYRAHGAVHIYYSVLTVYVNLTMRSKRESVLLSVASLEPSTLLGTEVALKYLLNIQ